MPTKMFVRITEIAVLVFAIFLISCTPKPTVKPQAESPALKNIDHTIAGMSVEEKVGQVFMPTFRAVFYNNDNAEFQRIAKQVKDYHIGGLYVFAGDPYSAAINIKRFQEMADIPLLISSDFEWGIPMRINPGTRFPENMGISASRNVDEAYQAGQITAKEARALGVQITFSPDMDVNNNPDNPIINNRSYGEDPALVSKMGTAYIKGVQSEHVAACAKHYPGHGDTDQDSHILLPTIDATRARLDSIELVPFKAAIDAGVQMIMAGHIALPNLPSGNTPATLSPYLLQHVLRDSLGFKGTIITDAMRMGGIVNGYWPGEAAVDAINAGADILLMTPDFSLAYHTVVNAVRDGRIPMERLNAAVRHVLELKKWAKVDENRFPDLKQLEKQVDSPKNLAKANQMFVKSITLVKDSLHTVPLDAGSINSMVSVIITDDIRFGFPGGSFLAGINSRIDSNQTFLIGPETSDSVYTAVSNAIDSSDAVALGVFVRFGTAKGTIGLPEKEAAWLQQVLRKNKPIVTVGFGTPYLLRFFPDASTYLATYSTSGESQRTVVRSIFGEVPISGKLPITLPAGYPEGHGLDRGVYSNVWKYDPQPKRFKKVFDLVEQGIADSVAPGMAFLIARNGKVLAKEGFGHFTYDDTSAEVTPETIFDLASLTKVSATTPLAMKMYEKHLLHLDEPVKSYLPGFSGGMKDSVTIYNLLTHTAGLPPFIKFWEVVHDSTAVVDSIIHTPLIYTPGDSSVYSDLGLILMGKILEKLGQKPEDQLVKEMIYQPLGMKDTQYNPPSELKHRIAPTEFDRAYRHRQIWGVVHDENAAYLGGVAGHAGLFSTVGDLGRYGEMYLSNGYYNGEKFLHESTIKLFTKRQNLVGGSTRAIGWDTPSRNHSWSGDYMSPEAFLHTGFTGTSIVIDPKWDVVIVLLTNRVYPTRRNLKILRFRPKFHNAVMKALLTPEELKEAKELHQQIP